MFGGTESTIAALRDAAQALRSVTTPDTVTAMALKTAIDVLSTQLAVVLADIDETKTHESEGASSITTWARRELHQDAKQTRQMVRAAKTMHEVPDVGVAARAAEISLAHVDAFTFALKHVGVEQTHQIAEPLLAFAKSTAPGDVFTKVRQARDVLHSDQLDQAWLDGMDKHDFRLTKTPEGYVPTGFFDIELGAMVDAYIKNQSVPRDADDTRTPAQRRIDALADLFSSALANGLPADNGIKPHIFVTVEAETLQAMADDSAAKTLDLDLKPAHLEGFGAIGPQLLDHLLCGAEITPILVRTIGPNTEVLDVGRTERYATLKQATAIRLRQGGVCAAPGCKHPIAHNHHKRWWSRRGRTDLDNLIGLCRKCHSLVHAGRLDLARAPNAA